MNAKAVAILVLVLLAIGAGVAFFIVYQQKQAEEQASQQLLQAQALLKQGGSEKAVALLSDLIQRYPKFSGMAQVLFDLGNAYEKISPEQALAVWEKLLAEFPDASMTLETHRAIGWLALEQGVIEQAEQHFEALTATRRLDFKGSAVLGLGAVAELRGDTEKAREAYYRVVEEYSEEKIVGEAMDRLSRLNTELLFSPRVSEFAQRYEIQPGDNLISIAARFNTTAYLLKEMNGIGDQLRAGMRITVPKPGGVRLVVDKSDKYLSVYSNMEGTEGKFIKRYLVGVAQYEERTPPGIYVIYDKLIDPPWYPPTGGVLPPGDPKNALGTRWMGFRQDGKDTSLGIHGNNDPDTIGTNASAGCIRMRNAEVEELFKIARQGTEVEIVE